jgi:SPP1 family predicted phage head-tail adaptor
MYPTQDAAGAEVPNWGTFASVLAEVKPITGTKQAERFINKQMVAMVTHLVTVRYVAGVTPKMRIQFGTRYFGIKESLNTEERNIELAMYCKELV